MSSRGWVDPVPGPLRLKKSGSPGNRTQDLWICSQKLWPLDHRGGPHSVINKRLHVKRFCVLWWGWGKPRINCTIWGFHSGGFEEYRLLGYDLPPACLLVCWTSLRPWRWRRYVPPKRRLLHNGLHGVISQKIILFKNKLDVSICLVHSRLVWYFKIF
jgi:hypothetical protein